MRWVGNACFDGMSDSLFSGTFDIWVLNLLPIEVKQLAPVLPLPLC